LIGKTLAAAAIALAVSTAAASSQSTSSATTYHMVDIDGVKVFYREAGPPGTDPAAAARLSILFAHVRHADPAAGRPLSHCGARLSGFGQSDAPPPANFVYTFDHLAEVTTS